MAELFRNGAVADAILGFMLFELLLLGWWRRRSGRGLPAHELITGLGAGAALLLALRAALLGAAWTQVAAWLALALVAHVADLTLRWRGKRA